MRFPSLLNVTLVLGIYFSDLSVNEVLGQKKALTKQVKLQHDNDAFRIEQKTDRYYSFGLLLNYSTAVTENNPLKKTSEKLGFKESEKLIFDNLLYLKGYTPEFQTDPSNVSNRPFAGVLNWEPSVYISNEKRLWRFGIVLGVRGKISGAEWVQDNFHDLIGDKKFEGWRYQLPNKFLFGVNGTFVKPWALSKWAGLFSESNLSLGNYQSFLEENIGFRLGRFNSITNSTLFQSYLEQGERNKSEYYFVIKFFGKTIFSDTTLAREGDRQEVLNPFDKKNLQAGYHAAFHLQTGRFGAELSHTRNSTESNVSGKHSYGSLAFSYSFH
jgi:hypothetical protein